MGDKYLTRAALSTLTDDDQEYIIELATKKGTLDWSPKKNWVENNGGLPKFIEEVALALVRKGWSRERAIATAINKIKKWARGGEGVNADTVAKAVAALAAWNALKAKAKIKRAAKKG